MGQVFLVTGVIALLAAHSLHRGGRRADRPLTAFLVALGAAALLAAWQGWAEVGTVALLIGLGMLMVPPQAAIAAQIARIRGAHRASTFWETLACLCLPSAIRRLHRGAAAAVSARVRGRIDHGAFLARLRDLDRLVPGPGVLRLNEALVQAAAARGEWDQVLQMLPPPSPDPFPFQGWTMAARVALLRALLARDRIAEAADLVRRMDVGLEEGEPGLACPGDLAEVPEVWRDRAGLEWLVALGEDPRPWVRPFSPLRVLVPASERRSWARKARAVRESGRAPWVREAADAEQRRLRRTAGLPQFLTSVPAMPPATLGLVLWNLTWLVLLMATGSSLDGSHLFQWGGAVPSRVFGPDPWRLVPSMSLHAGPLHFLVNMLFLAYAGGIAERLLGPRILLWTYLVSGIAGGLLAMAIGREQVLVGASGAIAGVFAAAGIGLWRGRRELPGRWFRRNLRSFVQTLVANVLLGMALPMISLSAHGGGFLGGLVAAGTSRRASRFGILPAIGVSAACLAAVGVGVFGLYRSWERPLGETLPMRSVVVRGEEGGVRWEIPLEVPITWLDVREQDPQSPPAFAGAAGQLAAVQVQCRETWKRIGPEGPRPLAPGDARGMADLIREATDESDGIRVREGENGFALVEQAHRDGNEAISAHRQDPQGVIHLHFFFDRGSREATLLPRMLRGVGPLTCREAGTAPGERWSTAP
ncbi:MAG TPA: rhomboid family intramembrane serine protease [Myxococcota bacterium]|nr:rhomboid family intramembrane serine protease [Myxococcota bacterium]HQK51091.1 rhomboid family intramembrane serine protease [Myxococcota bacterium]